MTIETGEQFHQELDGIACQDYHSTSLVERGLMSILQLASAYLDKYLQTDEELIKCIQQLLNSKLFSKSRGYVRRKLISLLVMEYASLEMTTQIFLGAILLIDGKLHISTLEMIREEAGTNVILQILCEGASKSKRLGHIYLELLYELCKVQRIQRSDLNRIDYEFIAYLLSMIENQVDYDEDPHGFAAIKVLLALNEQYMVNALYGGEEEESSDEQSSDEQSSDGQSSDEERSDAETSPRTNRKPRANVNKHNHRSRPLENKMFTVLKSDLIKYRSFGENIVFFFNRVPDKCLQLMIMKLLYLIFTTKETCDFLYLNDLKVLVDIILRELYDMSNDDDVLMHTYLRILYPLLKNTQLKEDHYKCKEIVMLLEQIAYPSTPNFSTLSEETMKLATRCLSIRWLGWHHRSPVLATPEQQQPSDLPLPRPHPSLRSGSFDSLSDTAPPSRTLSSSSSISDQTEASFIADENKAQVVSVTLKKIEDSHRDGSGLRPLPPPPRNGSISLSASKSEEYFRMRGSTSSDVDLTTYNRRQAAQAAGPQTAFTPERTFSTPPPAPVPRLFRNAGLKATPSAPAPPPPRR